MKKMIAFNPEEADDKLFKSLFAFIKTYKEKNNMDVVKDFNEFRASFSSFHKSFPEAKLMVLVNDNEVISTCETFPLNIGEKEEIQNIHIAFLEDEVLNTYRLEIERIISQWKKVYLKSKIETNNIGLLQSLSNQCFRRGNETVYFNLSVQDVNQQFLDDSIMNTVLDKFKYELNDELKGIQIKEVAELMTILLNDMVRDDYHQVFLETSQMVERIVKRHKKFKHVLYHILLRDEEDTLIGMSIVVLNNQTPKTANQFMTGVLKEYRGKGLSSWMKTQMYNELMKNHPTIENIKSDCFAGNKPMIHINQKMGFKEMNRKVELVYDNK